MKSPRILSCLWITTLAICSLTCIRQSNADTWVRFKPTDPAGEKFAIHFDGFIHKTPWRLPRARFPEAKEEKYEAGKFTPWINLTKWGGAGLHRRMMRAGGIAEFPQVTARFEFESAKENLELIIELADAPDPKNVKKRWQERMPGTTAGFLVSPNLAEDVDGLESATEMADRRLSWAKEATGGKRKSPEHHIIQTSLWSAQRPDLNLKEAETLWLLGFNVLGNQHAPIPEHYQFRQPGHTHNVAFGPGSTKEQVDQLMKGHADKQREKISPGAPFGLSDEIASRPRIGDNEQALAHFHTWLQAEGIKPAELGVKKLEDVVPIEVPDVLKERMAKNEAAARRIFYYTSRFRQLAATERIRWHSQALRKHLGKPALSTALLADHPYFGGTGLGMGIKPDSCWGNHALAIDWFDLGRKKALDLIGIEDWMGLQYMYGPNSTWEGFQLMGYQASMVRSGARGQVPIIAWITPSDETNLRLKSASALCQGAAHFFYWTYGPTCTSTENYWSDLRGAYDGVAHITSQLSQCGDIIAKGKLPKTRVALLYSISSDLFQPFDYIHMLERRCLYLSLVHDHFVVDMLTEEDVEAGRLKGYSALYTADPCITTAAMDEIREWVRGGGTLFGTCAAGSMNEFAEPADGLADVFGIAPNPKVTLQPGNYRVRGQLNPIPHLDEIDAPAGFGVIGMKVAAERKEGEITFQFGDGSPAVITNSFGKGKAVYVATTPGVSYAKDAKFVPAELKEKWPQKHRDFINAVAKESGAKPPVELSVPIVEAGLYTKGESAALVLANFTYEPIKDLKIKLALPFAPTSAHSCETGKLNLTVDGKTVSTSVDLGINDIVIFKR